MPSKIWEQGARCPVKCAELSAADTLSNASTAWSSPADSAASSRCSSRPSTRTLTRRLSDNLARNAIKYLRRTTRRDSNSTTTTTTTVTPFDDCFDELSDAARPLDDDGDAGAGYFSDVLQDLFFQEHLAMVEPDFKGLPAAALKARAQTIDWLTNIHERMEMESTSLFLAVSILDRYLGKRLSQNASRASKLNDIELVGVAAFSLATKFIEVVPPDVDLLVDLAGSVCSREGIVEMECHILTALNYEVSTPTARHFLEIFLQTCSGDDERAELAGYITELSLSDSSMLCWEPSRVAAAAVLLSSELLGWGAGAAWPATMVRTTRHSASALAPVARALSNLLAAAPRSSLRATANKYSKVQRSSVANKNFCIVVSL